MGLLDDAIREHLELKRRHGADPTEVARQESEALGPARRSAEPSEDEPPAERLIAEPEPELEYEPDPELIVEPERVPEFEPEPPPEPKPEPTARPIEPDIVDQPTMEHPAARPEPLGQQEPVGDAPEPRGAHRAPAPAEREQREDDVLEGTPEFLEETPEHDRLWFEQRPPRDFDFDD